LTWVIGLVALLVSGIAWISSGFGAFLIFLALFVIPTAIVALVHKSPTWLNFRKGMVAPWLVIAIAVVTLFVGSGISGATNPATERLAIADTIELADYTDSSGLNASSELDSAGLTVEMVTEDGSPAPSDWSGWKVVSQVPAPGTPLPPDATVTITLRAPKITTATVPSPSAIPPSAPPAEAAPAAPAPRGIVPPVPAPVPAAPVPPVPAPAPAPAILITPGAFCADAENGVVRPAANGKSYKCGGHGADANGHLHWNTIP
jgi:hypothetical protein